MKSLRIAAIGALMLLCRAPLAIAQSEAEVARELQSQYDLLWVKPDFAQRKDAQLAAQAFDVAALVDRSLDSDRYDIERGGAPYEPRQRSAKGKRFVAWVGVRWKNPFDPRLPRSDRLGRIYSYTKNAWLTGVERRSAEAMRTHSLWAQRQDVPTINREIWKFVCAVETELETMPRNDLEPAHAHLKEAARAATGKPENPVAGTLRWFETNEITDEKIRWELRGMLDVVKKQLREHR